MGTWIEIQKIILVILQNICYNINEERNSLIIFGTKDRKERKMKKFELTGETKVWNGTSLHRIRALVAFENVNAGELGGWIEKESNLSQDGNAWVFGGAKVYGNAKVYDNAWVYDNARVYGNAWVSCNAQVYGNALVYGDARVRGNARVGGNAQVGDNTRVDGNTRVN